jgi:AcrR family transcriptional regulator
MDTIRREAGVSAGAMYRYFATKDDLIRAAIAESLLEVGAIIDDAAKAGHESAAAFVERMLEALDGFCRDADGPDLYRVAVQGWAHAQSDPGTAEVIQTGFAELVGRLTTAAQSWSSEPQAVGATLGRLVAGHVVLRAAGSETTPAMIATGLPG